MSDHQGVVEVVKASPPVATVVAWLAGIDLQQWVFVATLIYTLLLIIDRLLIIKHRRQRHAAGQVQSHEEES